MLRQFPVVFLLLFSVVDSNLAQKPPNEPKDKGVVPPGPVAPTKKFLTLNGGPPDIVANGGISGLYPHSSQFAYSFAMHMSLPDTILYCNIQLSSDNLGLCVSHINIDKSTTAGNVYPKGEKTFNINGRDVRGWFALDYPLEDLRNKTYYTQSIYTRSLAFDNVFPVLTPDDIAALNVTRMWLNVENDLFYNQNKLSAAQYIKDSTQFWIPSHISSPEIGFLKFMSGQIDKAKTKLIFKFLGKDELEPTNRETYGAILNNLAAIKPFASAILVPKDYIIPLTKDKYTEPPTTLVVDAHKIGIEVYAYGFLSDDFSSYNYSYDPIQEYLQFIDNPQFSVDGVLTDFPSTASSSVACFAQSNNLTTKSVNGLVISHNGASGDYPGCTDLAYQKAIADGADIIDCNVQMTKDKVPFCLGNIDLSAITTALATYMDRSNNIPEIQAQDGIFAFDFDWSEIEALQPTIEIPWKDTGLVRNPRYKNKGKFVTLASFLELAKTNKTGGVLINIENAAFLASKKGIGVVDAATSALTNASFDKQTEQKVLIQSDDSSVLSVFKNNPNYQRVLTIKRPRSDVPKEVVAEIKKNANAIAVDKETVIQQNAAFFTAGVTNVVEEMHAENISVYITPVRNEYVYLCFDYVSDPYSQLATFFSEKVDGVITDFPATASAFLKNPCSDYNNPNNVYSVRPIGPGELAQTINPVSLPPALPPKPAVESSDVVDPPLPPVAKLEDAKAPSSDKPSDEKSGGSRNISNLGIALIVSIMVFGSLSFF